jgi:predicted AAA+ superfamily ATPase
LAKTTPHYLLQGATPKLIDEWQVVPTLWDAIRGEVDHRRALGQFIITGSAVPADRSKIVHTGTGRITPLLMRPMSLWESGESTGEVSLAQLFNQPEQLVAQSKIDSEELAFLVCRGGWPMATNTRNKKAALKQATIYYNGLVGFGNGADSDISRADGVKRSPERTKLLMRSLSRHQGTQASLETIYNDMAANDDNSLNINTISSYINALKAIFTIEDMPAWNPQLRSKTAIRTSDTRYFVDSSIAAAALRISPDDLLNDLNTFGLLLETMAVRDLRVYTDALDGNVYHYRDKNGLECDAVVHLENGKYGLVEIKLGGETRILEGIETLNKLGSNIDTSKMKAPSFKMVLTGTGSYAYKRSDGVLIVPIGCLRN